jgi:general secretion pathway protein G
VLLVLIILVLLGGTATLFFINVQKSAYIKAAKNQINQFESALDLYRLSVGAYPSEGQGLNALISPPPENAGKWEGPYVKTPTIPLDPWETPYKYTLVNADAIQITSAGPDKTEGTADDIAAH